MSGTVLLKGIDWTTQWQMRMAASCHCKRLAECGISAEAYWDDFTFWEEFRRYSGYPGAALERIRRYVTPETTILEIGPGDGSFTIPLAKICRSITAVEPSAGQISQLVQNAQREGLHNIRIIPKRWEHVKPEELSEYGIVLAAHSLLMEDIRSAIERMCRAASQWVFLLHCAGRDMAPLLSTVTPDFNPGPDYIAIYNMLYQMGFMADVEIIRQDYEIPLGFQFRMCDGAHRLTAEERDCLYRKMEAAGKIAYRDGALWLRRQPRDALVIIPIEGKQSDGRGDR